MIKEVIMEETSYIIKNDKFDKIQKMAEEVNGNLKLLIMFCKDYEDIEDFYIAANLMKNTKRTASSLDYEFCKIMFHEEEE